MARTIWYRQCRLEKQLERGTAHQTSWIPETVADVGRVLRLRDVDGDWHADWVVAAVDSTRLADAHLPDSHRAVKHHRKATGDALPKE